MTAMVKADAPSQAVPNASFLPLQIGLSNEQRQFSPMKKLSRQQTSLSTVPLLIQPKLAIGEPNDQYEREADHVADTIMRMPEPKIQRT